MPEFSRDIKVILRISWDQMPMTRVVRLGEGYIWEMWGGGERKVVGEILGVRVGGGLDDLGIWVRTVRWCLP